MDAIFYRVMLNDRVKIEPRYLSKDFRKYILQKLKSNIEGICSKHGFVREDSIEIYKVAPGNIELVGLNGSIVFDVYFYAEVCNPLIGNVIKATVSNVNKFGILAEAGGILEIIIAKNSVNIVHDNVVDLETIKIGDSVFVEVVGKKFELNDKKISIVGKIVSGTPVSWKPVATKKDKREKEEEEEEIPQDDDAAVANETEDGDDSDEEKEDSDDDADSEAGDGAEQEDDDDIFKVGGNEFFDSDDDEFEEAQQYGFYSDEEGGGLSDEGSDTEYD